MNNAQALEAAIHTHRHYETMAMVKIKGSLSLPKRMNFRKVPKGGSFPKISNIFFWNEGVVKAGLEHFQKDMFVGDGFL